jgi:hypothetical protein
VDEPDQIRLKRRPAAGPVPVRTVAALVFVAVQLEDAAPPANE